MNCPMTEKKPDLYYPPAFNATKTQDLFVKR